MTATKRLFHVLSGVILLLLSAGMMMYPNEGYVFVVLFVETSLLLYGLRLLVYYFTMARFMVGGIATFYKSIIAIDFGLFIFTLDNIPQKSAMLYLILCMAFSGCVDILHALESRRISAPWRLHITYGFLKLGTAIICLFFLNSMRMMTYLYCIGLIHSAALAFIKAFRKSTIVYIG